MAFSRSSRALALAGAVAALSGRVSAAQEEHVRGVVGAVSGDTVTVKGPDGKPQQLKLGEKTRVSLATRADLSALAQDAYVGTTAVEARDGTLRAVEVHVFPEAMRGAGEGHRPWDLKPKSSMTNAKVSGVEGAGGGSSTMTNAKVSGVGGASGGKRLTLTYAGGEKTVLVPPGTPVVRLEPSSREALAPGQHVFAAGARQADGSVAVDRMVAGKDGVVPPM